MNKFHLVAAACSAVLVGCGGSSSSDGVEGAKGGSPGKLALTVSRNQCASNIKDPVSGASVLLHDASGKILETLTTNNDGKVEHELSSSVKHLSVISKNASEDGTEVKSFVNFNGNDFNELRLSGRCTCYSHVLDASELLAVNPGYTVYDASYVNRPLSSRISFCGSAKPVIIASADGSDVRGAIIPAPSDQQEVIQLTNDQFVHQGVLVNIPFDAAITASVRGYTAEGQSTMRNAFDFGSYVFPSVADNHFAYLGRFDTVDTQLDSFRVSTGSVAKSRVSNDGSVANLKYPIDLQSELATSGVPLIFGDSANYDFSHISPDFSELLVSVSLRNKFTNEYINIDVSAPISGITPEFEYGYEIEQFDGELDYFRLYLMGYENAPRDINAYRQWIQPQMSNYSASDTKYDNYKYIYVSGFYTDSK